MSLIGTKVLFYVSRLGFYQRSSNRYTITKLQNEVLSHYQNQLFKQIHVIILGLDVLGNPLAFIRGIAEGVESLFYEPYKVGSIHGRFDTTTFVFDQGAIEGPIEFAEGVATGVLTLVGSTVGTTVGAISKITGVIGQSLATLTFDHEYQKSRIRRKETAGNAVTDIAVGGTNVVKVRLAKSSYSFRVECLSGICSWHRWCSKKTNRWCEV